MVVIGYDRYNVIVKGLKGTKITYFKAFIIIILLWIYSIVTCATPFVGWGEYAMGTVCNAT